MNEAVLIHFWKKSRTEYDWNTIKDYLFGFHIMADNEEASGDAYLLSEIAWRHAGDAVESDK